jgi:3-hydroxyacyl-CoA dehydrogenase
MFQPFRTAAVLGAGVMGAQIAAHLANAGLTVDLLDLAAPEGDRNGLVEAAFRKALKQSPPVLFTEQTARRIRLGNFDEHFHRVAHVDWVIEAVVENLAVKQALMERLEGAIAERTIVSTNTSGLPIHTIVAGRSASFRRRFLGTHFFNPPRYLKLLELIPTADTDAAVLERLQWFGRLHLGKGVAIANDTPGFIANRIGMFATMLGLQGLTEQGYTLEEIDTLTGPLVGRPKSATFRTADLVGLDILLYVANGLYNALSDDESRAVFRVPQLLRQLVETGTLGAKTGQGFYKKEGQQILSLNPATLAYEPPQPLNLGDIASLSQLGNLRDRLRALYRDAGRAGTFFRSITWETCGYAARRLPEIADSPADIDRAIRWGFGWELGPFEMWDALGFETVLADMKANRIAVPAWVEDMAMAASGFYRTGEMRGRGEGGDGLEREVYLPSRGFATLETPADEIDLAALKADPQRTLWENSEAALLDLGDGVVLYEFRSKGNTLSAKVVEGLSEVLDILAREDYRGLVIGNGGEHFSAGANLVEMAALAQQGGAEAIVNLLETFQSVLQRLHYFPKPIVAAIQGRVLGGGCELVMACPQVVAAAETYIGLVELSVGLIPGAGGIMRMAARAAERAATEYPSDLQPFLRSAFETIATAKVSGSAYEAQALGYLPACARIVMNGNRRLYVAKEEVLRLDREGYLPPPENVAIAVLGRPARSLLQHAAYVLWEGGFISAYDRFLADRLAYVITGGELTVPSLVHEDYLLALEREAFIPLLNEAKTQERIAHLLKTKKPLRN